MYISKFILKSTVFMRNGIKYQLGFLVSIHKGYDPFYHLTAVDDYFLRF